MSKELRPYVPTHPGNVLKDELQVRPYAYLLKSSVIALSDKLRLIVYEKKNDFDRDSYKKYYWSEFESPYLFNELKNKLNI